MDPDPVIKQLLKDMKEASCGAFEICKDRTEPLGLTPNTSIVLLCLDVAEFCARKLLDQTIEPTFNPPDAGRDYTPIDMSNGALGMFAENLKQELCDALDEYCAGNTPKAARHVHRAAELIGGYRIAVGPV